MRHILISGLIMLATIVAADASDRYPTKKRYVNQTGQVMTIGQAPQLFAVADSPPRRTLPGVQIVPAQFMPAFQVQDNVRPTERSIAIDTRSSSRDALVGSNNVDPKDWPSERDCCLPGQAYFNEEPKS